MATSLMPEFTSLSGGQVLFFDLLGVSGLNLCQCHEKKRRGGGGGHCFRLKGNIMEYESLDIGRKQIKDIFGENGNFKYGLITC